MIWVCDGCGRTWPDDIVRQFQEKRQTTRIHHELVEWPCWKCDADGCDECTMDCGLLREYRPVPDDPTVTWSLKKSS